MRRIFKDRTILKFRNEAIFIELCSILALYFVSSLKTLKPKDERFY